MPIARPEVGELVKTVVELVDAVNQGGGGVVDWANIEVPEISLTATLDDTSALFRATGVDASVGVGSLQGEAVLFGGNELATVTASADGSVTILASDITSSGDSVVLSSVDGLVSLNMGDEQVVRVAEDDVKLGWTNAVNNKLVTVQANGSDSGITIQANGADSEVIIQATGSSGFVSLLARNVLLEATAGDVSLEATESCRALSGAASVECRASDGAVVISCAKLGFFSTAPVVQPDGVSADAALEALGLAVNVTGGGGGAFTDLIEVADDQSVSTLVDGVPSTFVFDPTASGGAYYRIEGTAMSVVGGKISIDATGWYDVDSSLVVIGGSTADAYGFLLFVINGVPSNYGLPGHTFIPQSFPAVALQARLKRVLLAATDTVEIMAIAVGDDVAVQVCLTEATRVA